MCLGYQETVLPQVTVSSPVSLSTHHLYSLDIHI
jgi:hypothetical protein